MNNRRRSSSFAVSETPNNNLTTKSVTRQQQQQVKMESLQATQELWELVCGYAMEDPTTQQTLLHSTSHVCLAKALLDRAHQLDHYSRSYAIAASAATGKHTKNHTSQQHNHLQSSNWLLRMLKQGDGESGYTPIHKAVLHGRLPVLLLLLRYSVADQDSSHGTPTTNKNAADDYTPVMSHHTRLDHRPMALLQQAGGGGGEGVNDEEVRAVLTTVDNEGLTAIQLLEKLQVRELQSCRNSLVFSPLQGMAGLLTPNRPGRPQQDDALQADHEEQGQNNELGHLHNYIMQQQEQGRPVSVFHGYPWNDDDDDGITTTDDTDSSSSYYYACEVLSFGRPNHLALGVQGGKKNHHHERTSTEGSTSSSSLSSSSSAAATSFRPHRVQSFAQDRVGRAGSAVAIAAAAHHTLVVTRRGQLFAFGVGTGGRLGTGNDEKHCPSPTRVLGPLFKRRVVAIAAAENHSLCVTSEGAVYAFGSNRFGQLGYSSSSGGTGTTAGSTSTTADTSNAGESASRCCLPRRVDDLFKKRVLCISVAAGEKHSVALSQKGEVYVWGCNASGQLGINHRRSTTNNQTSHKVQRVESLWTDDKQKRCFEIAASSQATLVLAKPTAGGLPVNQVYAWGHGNHVPSKVHFVDPTEQDSQRRQQQQQQQHKGDKFLSASAGRRTINPVSIASARHHNVAITSDGRVYTWGFHADSLGGSSSTAVQASKADTSTKAGKNNCSRPQLVTGMLPEQGGGVVIAVSASENHTAVVTSEGALFTWGASFGKGVLGHEGVRWQPSPKRVGGVSRAVGVSAAKEHTILLMGATFPSTKDTDSNAKSQIPDLEQISAQVVAKHVDLFNVLPVLITAERTNCQYLVEYCQKFIRLNLDGVLNVGQKSIMDTYLDEHVASGLLLLDEDPRDRSERPLLMRIVLAAAGTKRKGPIESETILSNPVEWIESCDKLSKKDSMKQLVNRMRKEYAARPAVYCHPKLRKRSSSSLGSYTEAFGARTRSSSIISDSGRESKLSSGERCIMLTTNMDLSTRELVQQKHDCLSKEVRGLKKRLNQIAKLESKHIEEEEQEKPGLLSSEQQEKVARRPQLESELYIFEPALARVEKRMMQYNLRPRRLSSEGVNEVEKISNSEKKCIASPEQKSSDGAPQEGRAPAASIARAVPLRCATCNIACPDETSYALHITGRKHRNKIAQEAENDSKKTAAAIMEERHRQQLQGMASPVQTQQLAPTPSAWPKSKAKPTKSAAPKYKLPSPSNQAHEIVEKKSKGLQQIMAEEERTAGPGADDFKGNAPPSVGRLQLPPGSAPAMKSPPWASKPLKAPTNAAAAPSTWMAASPAKIPLQLPKGAPPTMSSPPWASKPLKNAVASPSGAFPSLSSPQGSRTATAFGDFLRGAPAPPLNAARSKSSVAPWSASKPAVNRPGFGDTPLVQKQKMSPNGAACFSNIQKKEVEFKTVQDQTFQDNGKWFIERRERADSLAAIQNTADKEREEQLMIEEQIRIEQEIYRELALQKKQDDAKKKRQQQKANKKQRNKNKKESGGNNKQQAQQSKSDRGGEESTPATESGASTTTIMGGPKPKLNKGKGANNRRRKNSNANKPDAKKATSTSNVEHSGHPTETTVTRDA